MTATSPSPRGRAFLWVFSIFLVVTAGSAFAFKLYEFIHVALTGDPGGSNEMASFLIPVVTYLVVAAGYFCLFLWAYATGQFRDVEAPKLRMLEMQAQIDAFDRAAAAAGPNPGRK